MRSSLWMVALALTAGCSVEQSVTPESVGDSTAQALSVATYNFGSVAAPGKCLDVAGGSTASGTNVQSWSCNGSGAQSWRAEDRGGGVFRLVNTTSAKCLDAGGWGTTDGTQMILWDCTGGANQDFRMEDRGNGNVRMINVNANKCLDVSGGSTADGAKVQLWSCNATAAQDWHPASITLAGGVYNFGGLAAPGKCMDLAAGSAADGANIQEWTCNGTGAQSFRVDSLGGSAVRLVNPTTNKCVDVNANGSADGTNVQQWSCNGSAAQSFRLDDAGNGNVRIVHNSSNKCVDIAAAGTADGTNIQLWSCNGTNAQTWRPALLAGGASSPPPSNPPPSGGNPPPSSGPWSSLAPRSDGKWVRVKNMCPFPIWVHGAGSSGTLQPDDQQLPTGTSRDYLAPNEWSAARVTAYGDGPRQNELDKAEFTFTGGVLNFNVTYVDWVGLPLEIIGVGGNCTAAADTTGCYAREDQINNTCPQSFLHQGKKCLSARTYCLDPNNQGSAYCHKLDSAIANCPSCPKASTPEVFACSGAYAEQPRWCAALNRAMTGDPDNGNSSLYYQNGAYNDYAKWVHQVCPDIYAFSYDDWLGHGGFRACSGDEVRVTFCPSG